MEGLTIKKIILNALLVCVATTLFIAFPASADGIAEDPVAGTDLENLSLSTTVIDNTFTEIDGILGDVDYSTNSCPTICLENPVGGGTLSNPLRVHTNKINVYGMPLEYTIANGQFIIFQDDRYDYYEQNATQGYFNAITGSLTRGASNAVGTYLTYRGIDRIPYVQRIFKTQNNDPIYNWGFLKTASSAMIQYKVPFWGKIVSSPVPKVGTKEVIVYIKTKSSSKWHNRVRFVINKNGSITYNTWYVK